MKCEEVLGLQMPLQKLGERTKAAMGDFERTVLQKGEIYVPWNIQDHFQVQEGQRANIHQKHNKKILIERSAGLYNTLC